MNYVYNRSTKEYEPNSQYGGKALRFLYRTVPGRMLLKLAVSPFVSRINGAYNRSRFSKGKIEKFIEQYGIFPEDYEQREYSSFADFFIRKRKEVKVEQEKSVLISPADGKLLVYKVEKDLRLHIKQSDYTLEELVRPTGKPGSRKAVTQAGTGNRRNGSGEARADADWLDTFRQGYCMVFRLAMDDYHRYCFVDDGSVVGQYPIKGRLHTVSSISEKHKVYSENSRVINCLETRNFGEMLVIEVGALLVGKIQNHPVTEFKKGDEKGYFELGGSTIILLTQSNIAVDEDILENSRKGIETKVHYGERIGVKSAETAKKNPGRERT